MPSRPRSRRLFWLPSLVLAAAAIDAYAEPVGEMVPADEIRPSPDDAPPADATPAEMAADAAEVIEIRGDSAPEQRLAARRAVSVVDAEALARENPRTTAEALAFAPGVTVQKTNHAGGSPIVRGLTGQKVLLVLDGFRLNNAIMRPGPSQYLATIDPGLVGGIEVVRGAGSVLYGSDAIGGVVQVHSRAIEGGMQRPRAHIAARTASADRSGRGRLELAGEAGAVRARVGVSAARFGDLRGAGPLPTAMGAPSVPHYDGDRQRYTGYHERAGDGRVSWQLDPTRTLTAAVYAYRQSDAPRTDKCSPESCLVFDHQDYDLSYVRFRDSDSALGTLSLGLALARTGEERSQRDSAEATIERERDTLWALSGYARAALPAWRRGTATVRLSAGLDAHHESLASAAAVEMSGQTQPLARGKFLDGSSQAAMAGYGLVELALGEAVNFDAGLRLSTHRARIGADPESGAPAFTARQTLPVANAGASLRVAAPVYLLVHAAQAFRAPNLYDLTAQSGGSGPGYQRPNPALVAETARSLEVGVQVRHPRLSGELFAYRSHLRDFITRRESECPLELAARCGDAEAVFRAVNADTASIRGVEAALRAELGAGARVHASATWTRGDARSAAGMSEPLPKIPPLRGAAVLSAERMSGFGAVAVRWALPQRRLAPRDRADARIPDGGTPGYAVVDARLGAALGDGWRATLMLENLFGTPYRVHGSGVDGPGRGVVLGLEAELR
ncbi:TonB-dependent receptor [Haliangium ochraceum]|uniref:TonB-dependent receptor plug n=1 Tax=Haliangium ochraceum (strain DSM 14365 / JCM 11303 / SMP-2) TaxID=502025 RepID=D0LNW5_HALO1|nr:TonB-dependent receptor [Haliangium ochraceum]ACY18791.1 TonB-dependent receptor plug [Haliangium ochraceum DSM 14365]